MNFGRGCRSPWPWLLVSILFASGCAPHYASTLHFRARFETDNFATAIEEFRKDVGQYPEQARGLKALLEGSEIAAWKGPYLSRIDRDPWGRPFGYRIPSTAGDRPFDVCQGASNFPQLWACNFPHPLVSTSGGRLGLFGADQSGSQLVLEPVRVAADVQGHGVMQHAIEDRGGDHAVAEHVGPGREALVTGEDHRPALVAATDQLEEEVRAKPIDRQVADLVDDEQLRSGVDLELVVQAAFAARLREGADHRRCGGELHSVAGLDRLEPEPDAQVCLAYAGWAEDDDVLAVADEVAAGELLELLPVDRGLVGEVEAIQRLDEREARHGGSHRYVLRRLAGHFLREDALEELGVRQLLARGLLQQRFEPLRALEQLQPVQVFLQPFQLRAAHCSTCS